MLQDEKIIDSLQKMGLTYYGAKTYTALVAIGPSSAGTIAQEADVPRSKIYETLKRLSEEGWVLVEKGRPLTYKPNRPKDIIGERKSALISAIEFSTAELSSIYEHQIAEDAPKVRLIRGMSNIAQRIEDMMGRANHDIVLLGALYSEDEISRIKKHLVSSKKRGINVRIITRPAVDLRTGTIDMIGVFSQLLQDLRIYQTPFIKFVVIDGREILIMFSKVTDDVADPDSAVAIWTPNPEVASLMQSNFNMMWEQAMPAKKLKVVKALQSYP